MAEKKGLLAEFKEFIVTGDLMTIAVAFIMGAIIKELIQSFIDNIFSGVIGLAVECKVDPTTKVKDCTGIAGEAWKTVKYGAFFNQAISFLVTAFVVFLMVKVYNKFRKPVEEEAAASEVDLLTEIRDELRKRG